MNESEVALVMNVITGMFKIEGVYKDKLQNELRELNLRPVVRSAPTWIDGAREVAVKIIQEAGEVTIVEVLEEYPLPPTSSSSVAGGVFKHRMFRRINTRTIQDIHGRWRTVGVYDLGE